MEQKRSYGRMLRVSTLVLLLEAALAVVVAMVLGQTRESPNAGGNYALGILALPFLAVVGVVLAAVVSAVLVLPAIWLSDALGRRFGGRTAWWWVPLAIGAVTLATVVLMMPGDRAEWVRAIEWRLLAAGLLTAPALLGRSRRRRLFVPVLLWGTLAVAGTGVVGALALGTGLLPEYRPPTVTPAALAGTWSDGKGGTLTLTPDGRATASGVDEDTSFDDAVKKCAGQGTWMLRPGTTAWDQAVDVTVGDCSREAWNVGGTESRVTLYHYIGDPDSWDLYELRKAPGSPR
ncbi:hypothetical protein [Streptomyces violascens]|uniref:hypothetical protein n=1 Tax=Streptomyces violascens TaxID=67381 RepID=UPI00368DF60B